MISSAGAGRTMTWIASAFLGFDGAALAGLGIWTGHPLVALIGGALFLSSGLVLVYWRWHRRQLEEIAAARRALKDEAESLRELLRGG
ncbi:MAG TPA: hypothetical protein VK688_04260 [Gemmatimonadales bacterium]|jgi:hypothetical protein|nr:hypothetical protein [Gemmatimonadales bacterium]